MKSPPEGRCDSELRTVFDRMTDGFLAFDADATITYANEKGREFVRAAMTERGARMDDTDIVGRRLWDSASSGTEPEASQQLHEAITQQGKREFETWVEPFDAWVEVRIFPVESGFAVYLRDVTARRRTEQNRQDGLKALQRLYAISSDHERDFQTKLTQMLKLGRSYLDLPNGIVTRIADGTQYIEVASASHPALAVGRSCPLNEAYCKRTVELEELLTLVNASDEGWEEDPAYARYKLNTYIGGRVWVGKQLYGTVCFSGAEPRRQPFTDTERTFVELLSRWVSYELERHRTRNRLERERDRLDQFAGVLSHDLRNPLQIASGRLELLRSEVDSEHVEQIGDALGRMDELIEEMLTLARQGSVVGERTSVRLAAVVEGAWATAETHGAALTVTVGDAAIRADEVRLRSLFENLFRNAVEHGSTNSRLADERLESGISVEVGLLEDRSGFYVADNGEGLTDAAVDRLFEPGYTTRNAGTGFGLSIVGGIVDAHGWDISVTELEAGGVRFEISGVEIG